MKRRWLVVAAVVVAFPAVAVVAASVWLAGDGPRTAIADAVRRSTGRDLTIAGPVRLAWALAPTLTLSDVSLGNPPGFPDPAMAHADRVSARLGLGGLLHGQLQIERIDVDAPAIRLERAADGRVNWVFARPDAAPTATPAPAASRGPRLAVALGAVALHDVRLSWGAQTLAAPLLAYDPASHAVSGTLASDGLSLRLSGTAGPFDTVPAPLDLRLDGNGVAAALAGTTASAKLSLQAADLVALAPLAGRPLPPLQDVTLTTALPGPGATTLRVGRYAAGAVTIEGAELTAPSPTTPATVAATAHLGALPLALTGQLGSLAALGAGPAPVSVRMTGSGLALDLSGTLDAAGRGQLAAHATADDLAAVAAASGTALPAFHGVDGTAALTLAPGTATLSDLHLTSREGDLAGDLQFEYAARVALRGALRSERLDWPQWSRPSPPQPEPSPSGRGLGEGPPPQPQPAATRVISDRPLPVAALRTADLDLLLAIGALRWSDQSAADLHAHLVLAGGTLRLDPLTATVGGQPATASLQVDAAAAPPTVHLVVAAPGLPLAALLDGSGGLDAHADLRAAGDTPRALAATIDGFAGLATVDARIDNAVLQRLLSGTLRLPGIALEPEGSTAVRCAALRVDATAGQLRVSALALDTRALELDGGGTVDLRDEALDLHLRPSLRLGGGLSVPVRLGGTLAAPKASLDPGAIRGGRVGILLGGPPPPDRCGPALTAARDGAAGPVPPAAPPTAPAKPADLLKGLFR